MNETNIIFIDDEKKPEWYGLPPTTPHAHNASEAIKMLTEKKYDVWYLDHDMGLGLDGSRLLDYVARYMEKAPEVVRCISGNPIGVKRIESVCKDHKILFGTGDAVEKIPTINGQSG